MAQYDQQVQVLSKPLHTIGGRECQTRISSTDKTVDPYTNRSLSVNPRVFVGNLEDDIGKDRLREFFLEHIRRLDRTSDIVDLYYPKPFRSFAFLTLSSSFVAKELVRQRDFIIDGSACEVTVAAPRKQDSEGQFGGERSRQLPFGPGTGLISSNDPRWNISAISSTSHQQKYQPTASIGSHHYPHAQQQRHFDQEQHTGDYQRQQQIFKRQNAMEESRANQQIDVWSRGEYRSRQLTTPSSDGVRHQRFLPTTTSIPF